MICICVFNLPQATAMTYFDDGKTHEIDYPINDYVFVKNSSSGTSTTLKLLPNGTVNNYLYALEDSQVTISGGSVNQYLYACDDSRVTLSSGAVGRSLITRENSKVTLSGGVVNNILEALENSEITFSDGSVNNNLEACDNSKITISGGSISGTIYAGYNSDANSTLIISGRSFAIDGNSVGDGEYLASDFPSGHITGTLESGDLLDNDFKIRGDATLVLETPEPASLSLLSLGGLSLRLCSGQASRNKR